MTLSPTNSIYLDYNATTPVDPAVCEVIYRHVKETFGNPSSTHEYGKRAHEVVEQARCQVAGLVGAKPEEIVFTSGGTEGSNHAIKGLVFGKLGGWFGRWAKDAHIIISSVEHPATVQPCAFLKRLGCKITVMPVDRYGLVDPDDVRKALTRKTTLVSIMHANNEVGTLQPIRTIADIAHAQGVPVHTDAAQSLGKVAVNVDDLGVDLLSMAGHKLYAPKGVGALYLRKGIVSEPFVHGAGHESGRRAGTENTPYIAGLAEACRLAMEALPEATGRLQKLRERLYERLRAGLGESIVLNGHPTQRLPNTLNVSFVGHVGAELLQAVPQIAASTGSACHEGQVQQSPVLCAMGVTPEIGKGAVRLSVGRFTTEEEIDQAAQLLIARAKKR
ncbi:MAG: cysteine desulfurase family protein [Gemmataceae bacterium]